MDLDLQERANYAATARKWEADWLTDAQEEVLIAHANRLTDRGLPPTS